MRDGAATISSCCCCRVTTPLITTGVVGGTRCGVITGTSCAEPRSSAARPDAGSRCINGAACCVDQVDAADDEARAPVRRGAGFGDQQGTAACSAATAWMLAAVEASRCGAAALNRDHRSSVAPASCVRGQLRWWLRVELDQGGLIWMTSHRLCTPLQGVGERLTVCCGAIECRSAASRRSCPVPGPGLATAGRRANVGCGHRARRLRSPRDPSAQGRGTADRHPVDGRGKRSSVMPGSAFDA